MFRYIIPTIIIGISITLFFVFTDPVYKKISELKAESVSLNGALKNYTDIQTQRDALTNKQGSMSAENLARLDKLLPSSIDNIRLILEIEKIASPYGMVLKNIKYDSSDKTTTKTGTAPVPVQAGGASAAAARDYGIWNLEFSTVGTYTDFLKFTRDLENNLRIVDISSISFSSNTDNSSKTKVTPGSEVYNYDFKIKTYWLKN